MTNRAQNPAQPPETDATDASLPTETANQMGDPAQMGPRSTEARGLTGEDRTLFQSHWDEFAGLLD